MCTKDDFSVPGMAAAIRLCTLSVPGSFATFDKYKICRRLLSHRIYPVSISMYVVNT